MTKKIAVVTVVLILAFIAGGCGKSKGTSGTGNTAKAKDPVVLAAETILKLKEAKQWEEIYGYLHPDIQAAVSKEEFVKNRSGDLQYTKIKYKDYSVDKVKMLKEWREKGLVFKDVAEVSYSVRVDTAVGEKTIGNTMRLAKDKDGKWKYLFWITK
ncbi:MAG: hypothetical protein ACOY4Q_00230 [Bacillota bacterium]